MIGENPTGVFRCFSKYSVFLYKMNAVEVSASEVSKSIGTCALVKYARCVVFCSRHVKFEIRIPSMCIFVP